LREALAHTEEETRALDQDVALALSGGKEELARFAARRLLTHRRSGDTLRAQLAGRDKEERTLAERVEVQQAQFESLRARVRAELSRRTESSEPGPWVCESAVADEEVELELLRRRQGQAIAGEGGR